MSIRGRHGRPFCFALRMRANCADAHLFDARKHRKPRFSSYIQCPPRLTADIDAHLQRCRCEAQKATAKVR
jgi:hypothetical protein